MRMLMKCSLIVLSVSALAIAQRGGGGHGGGGGGHASGGGGHISGGGFRAGAPSASPPAGRPALGTRPSGSYYAGSGHYRGAPPFVAGGVAAPRLAAPGHSYIRNYTWQRPTNGVWRPPVSVRRPIRPYPYGLYGFGAYPFFGYPYFVGGGDGYYNYDAPGYAEEPGDQLQYSPSPYMTDPGEEGPPPEQAYPGYPPIPYAPPEQEEGPPPAARAMQPEEPAKPITIVLKSGEIFQSHNYAIMNGMFWDLTGQNGRRIPLAQIDVDASAKASAVTGAAFPTESFAANPK